MCDLLLEESNVQPVSTPVTVCGDIHGQVEFQIDFCLVLSSPAPERTDTYKCYRRVCKYSLMGRQLLYLKPLVIYFPPSILGAIEGKKSLVCVYYSKQSV